MLYQNVNQFVHYDCPIVYSNPIQKTIIDIDGQLIYGFFDGNAHSNTNDNKWNFMIPNNGQFEKRIIDGNKIRLISLEEENVLLNKISDTELTNNLYLSKNPTTL